VKLLLDTHLLLWAAADSERLSAAARRLIGDADNERFFSAASLWELAIKRGLGRQDFQVDVSELRDGLLDNSYRELSVQSAHAISASEPAADPQRPFRSHPYRAGQG
jgi:PIN domain nuclease of toxin-antitoxin system